LHRLLPWLLLLNSLPVQQRTITITAPTDAGFAHSVDGSSYQTGTAFGGLCPDDINVTVKNGAIVSAPTSVIVNAVSPAAPTASVTQPPANNNRNYCHHRAYRLQASLTALMEATIKQVLLGGLAPDAQLIV